MHDVAGWPPGSEPASARSPGAPIDPATEAGPALISPSWALQLLLERGLLSAAEVLAGEPAAHEKSISHASFCVCVGGQPRWFVKVADPTRARGRDLGAEAAVYDFAVSQPALSRVIPRCLLTEPRASLVVTEAVSGAPLAASLAFSNGADHRQSAALSAYGRSVALVHSARPAIFGHPPWLPVALEPRWGDYSWLPRWCAWLLTRLSGSATIRIAFQQARREWRRTCLIHGDLRWANALLEEDADALNVWLVDWELACLGDPSWDVGSLVADVAAAIALGEGTGPAVDQLMPACTPLLSGYLTSSSLDTFSWASLIERSVRMAGVRLVQTIIEHGYTSPDELQMAEARLAPWMILFLTRTQDVAGRLVNASETSSHEHATS